MIKRVVKMTFQPEKVEAFLQDVFEASKSNIRAFPGCQSMELLRDTTTPNILFTLSVWDSEEALNTYRSSELFQSTWSKTKVLFADKAQAWSMDILDQHIS
jgi:quinol monooxygenase YgiN